MGSPIFSGAAESAPEAPTTESVETKEAPEASEASQAVEAAEAPQAQQEESAPADDSVLQAAEAAKAKQAQPIKKEEPPKQAAPKKEEPKAQPQPPKKYKIKVDGAEEEYDEDTLVKMAQLGRASNKRFQEAAAAKKQAEDFISMLKQDPRKVLTNPAIGIDLKKFAEDYLIEQIEREQLSPEQLKIKELEARIQETEAREKMQREEQERTEFQKLQDHYSQEYEAKIQDALGSSGLPRTAYTVKRMAEYMSMALQNNIDLEPKNVVELVRQDYMKDLKALIGQSDGDALLQLLGDETANKIRKSDLARLKSGTTPKPAPAAAPKEEQPRHPATNKYMTTHEWREWQKKQGA